MRWTVACSGWRTTYFRECPIVFSVIGLKTDEFLHLLLCLCPFPSSLLNHFQVMSILFQQYLLLLSSFLHSYCHFIDSGPDSSHANKFHQHLLCAALLCVGHETLLPSLLTAFLRCFVSQPYFSPIGSTQVAALFAISFL